MREYFGENRRTVKLRNSRLLKKNVLLGNASKKARN